jgi:hypothetical protein
MGYYDEDGGYGSDEVPDVIPFGKYEGEDIDLVRADPFYVQWLCDQEDIVRDHPWVEELLQPHLRRTPSPPSRPAMVMPPAKRKSVLPRKRPLVRC